MKGADVTLMGFGTFVVSKGFIIYSFLKSTDLPFSHEYKTSMRNDHIL
jgi:hypothetical protein